MLIFCFPPPLLIKLFDLSEKILRMPLAFFLVVVDFSSLLLFVSDGVGEDVGRSMLGIFSYFLIKVLLLAYVTSSLEE